MVCGWMVWATDLDFLWCASWIVGCTKISQGCRDCYAATAANSARLQQFDQYKAVVDGKGNWNGHVEVVPKVLDGLFKGKRSRRVFAPSVLKQCLMLLRMNGSGVPEPRYSKINNELQILENLHIGVTVENQAAANERIPLLLQTPAAVRFLSVEPLLESIDFQDVSILMIEEIMFRKPEDSFREKVLSMGSWEDFNCLEMLNQIIVGGESGSNARSFHLEWARSLIDQCREAGTKVFMKQTGSNAFYEGQPYKTKSRAGTDPMEWPEWARIQEFI